LKNEKSNQLILAPRKIKTTCIQIFIYDYKHSQIMKHRNKLTKQFILGNYNINNDINILTHIKNSNVESICNNVYTNLMALKNFNGILTNIIAFNLTKSFNSLIKYINIPSFIQYIDNFFFIFPNSTNTYV
jgi:hypothetical protein